jgi:hypothetical protein
MINLVSTTVVYCPVTLMASTENGGIVIVVCTLAPLGESGRGVPGTGTVGE